jgi:hypothetical protein
MADERRWDGGDASRIADLRRLAALDHVTIKALEAQVNHLRKSIANSDRDHWFAEAERWRVVAAARLTLLRSERAEVKRLLRANPMPATPPAGFAIYERDRRR